MAIGHGGARPGAGRKKGSRNKKSAALRVALREGFDPILFLCDVAMDEENDIRVRVDATKTILPYLLPKKKQVEVDMYSTFNGDPSTISNAQLEAIILEAQADSGC